jgi:hypothetical protein
MEGLIPQGVEGCLVMEDKGERLYSDIARTSLVQNVEIALAGKKDGLWKLWDAAKDVLEDVLKDVPKDVAVGL